MTKFSPWFPASIQPVHVGVYEAEWDSNNLEVDSGDWFNKWDGRNWYIGNMSTHIAKNQKRKMPSTVKLIRWRGISKDNTDD